MGATTICVVPEMHSRLVELSRATGSSLIETVRDASEALARQQFANLVAGELDELRSNPKAWADYLAEAAVTSVSNRID